MKVLILVILVLTGVDPAIDGETSDATRDEGGDSVGKCPIG